MIVLFSNGSNGIFSRSDMCTYKCNECGKVFTQRRIKKHLEREHKKSPTKQNYQTDRLTYYRYRT